MRLLEQTPTISGKVGGSFGIWFTLMGSPMNGMANTTLIVRFPPPGMPDPKGGKPTLDFSSPLQTRFGMENGHGFTFDEPAEIVRGDWIFEVWVAGKKMAEQRFMVQ